MRYIVKHILLWIGALLMLSCFSSCQNEDDNLDADTTVSLYLGSLDKPVYPEEINLLGGSRAADDVPGAETEVTTWQNGDVVTLTIKLAPITGNALIEETVELTHNGTAFTSDNNQVSVSGSNISLVLSLEHITAIKTAADNTYSLTVSASYEPSSGPSRGATAVSGEQTRNLTSACELANDFAPIVLSYTTARLRVYAGQDKTILFNGDSKITNTAGNAYYFGTLDNATSGFTIKQGETLVYAASAYNPVTLDAGKAYAIDATFYIPSNP